MDDAKAIGCFPTAGSVKIVGEARKGSIESGEKNFFLLGPLLDLRGVWCDLLQDALGQEEDLPEPSVAKVLALLPPRPPEAHDADRLHDVDERLEDLEGNPTVVDVATVNHGLDALDDVVVLLVVAPRLLGDLDEELDKAVDGEALELGSLDGDAVIYKVSKLQALLRVQVAPLILDDRKKRLGTEVNGVIALALGQEDLVLPE